MVVVELVDYFFRNEVEAQSGTVLSYSTQLLKQCPMRFLVGNPSLFRLLLLNVSSPLKEPKELEGTNRFTSYFIEILEISKRFEILGFHRYLKGDEQIESTIFLRGHHI